jgi:hypothetical protein
MQQITSDPFLLEIARTLDENNVRRRLELAHFPKKQRLIAAFRALERAGFAESVSDGDGTRWYPASKAIRSMKLEELKFLREERYEAALTPPFYFLIEASLADIPDKQLIQEYRNTIDRRQLTQWWRRVGPIVGGMAEGHFRMVGPEINGGFLFEPLGEGSGMEGMFLFSLGSRTSVVPVVEEIEVPAEIKGRESMFECLIKWAELVGPH